MRAQEQSSAWALTHLGLTSKGSLLAKYYREVKTGMQSEVGGTNVSAVESVGEVDHICSLYPG